MSKHIKTYPPKWQGDLLLACKKCQKKLKKDPDLRDLSKLKKTMKRLNKNNPNSGLHVMNVGCMDLCPSDGVTACMPSRTQQRLFILRSEHDIESLMH